MIIELGGFHALSDAILDNSISADNPSISESMIFTILHLIKYSSKPPDLHLRKVLSYDNMPKVGSINRGSIKEDPFIDLKVLFFLTFKFFEN